MAKEYKYFVLINDTNNPRQSKRITVILDHPIDDPDLEVIEENNSIYLLANIVVANFKLLSVTGTFFYRVSFETKEPLCLPTKGVKIITLDHIITKNSYHRDMAFIESIIRADSANKPLGVTIISFSEIPEE